MRVVAKTNLGAARRLCGYMPGNTGTDGRLLHAVRHKKVKLR